MKARGTSKPILWLAAIVTAAAAAAAEVPSPEEYKENWPRFPGPDGGGGWAAAAPPLTCDIKTGGNIAWTADVPVAGFSSPVVWGNRVFLSGGDETKCEVMCFDG